MNAPSTACSFPNSVLAADKNITMATRFMITRSEAFPASSQLNTGVAMNWQPRTDIAMQVYASTALEAAWPRQA